MVSIVLPVALSRAVSGPTAHAAGEAEKGRTAHYDELDARHLKLQAKQFARAERSVALFPANAKGEGESCALHPISPKENKQLHTTIHGYCY